MTANRKNKINEYLSGVGSDRKSEEDAAAKEKWKIELKFWGRVLRVVEGRGQCIIKFSVL